VNHASLVSSVSDLGPVPLQLCSSPHLKMAAIRRAVEQTLAGRVPAAFGRAAQLDPELVPSGIAALDDAALLGGLPRGCLTEICGPASSGRTTVLLAALAAATARSEACCLVDANDAFDPRSAVAAGIDCSRLLWVRCRAKADHRISSSADQRAGHPANHAIGNSLSYRPRAGFHRLEQALKITDIILQGGGFGLVAIDLADIAAEDARRIPLTSWFRFRRAVERTPTVLLVLEAEPHAKTCASAVLQLSTAAMAGNGSTQPSSAAPCHARLLEQIEICAEALRTPRRKHPGGTRAHFAATAPWARAG